MHFITQLGLIFAFTMAGEIFVRFVPGGLPATVMGMFFMFIALETKLLKPKHIQRCSEFLSGIMAFFFLPAVATVIQNFALIQPGLWQLLFIGTFCSFFTFFVTYGTVRILRILLNRKK